MTTSRFHVPSLFSFAVLVIVLGGCASDPAGADGSSLKPVGCAKTVCDVEHDQCMDQIAARERCGNCKDGCLRLSDPDFALRCVESCPCTGGVSYVLESECDYRLRTCRKSDDERRCADGQ